MECIRFLLLWISHCITIYLEGGGGGGGVITVGNVLSERRGDPICAFTWRVCCSQLDSFKELM